MKNNPTTAIALAFVCILLCIACEEKKEQKKELQKEPQNEQINEQNEWQIGTFTDTRDGKTYKTVKIGEQTWMAENLNYKAKDSKCYGEGGKVFNQETKNYDITLSNAEIQANCEKYGRLYFWETARKACPSGWHLPVNDEWEILSNNLGGKKLPETCECSKEYENMEKLKAKEGFAALLGGKFALESYDDDGNEKDSAETAYWLMNSIGGWLSASPGGHEAGNVWIFKNNEMQSDYLPEEPESFSVRCVQDR